METQSTIIILKDLRAFAIQNHLYKLENYWTLNCAADGHIYNDPARFKFERTAEEDDSLYIDKEVYLIKVYSTIIINIQTLLGSTTIILLNVALAPGFLINLVSLKRLNKKGVY